MDHGESEKEEDRDFNAFHDDDRNLDGVNFDLITEEFGIQDNLFQGVILGENVIGSLNSGMKESHIISDPISQNSSFVLFENEEEISHIHPEFGIGVNQTQCCDVVKVILNLDESREIRGTGENRENGSLTWGDISDNSDFNFNDVSLSMKCCIQHFNLDPKQAAAFNVICSSFTLSFSNDPTITKIGTDIEKENATRIFLGKGANSRLIMHLTGSGGSGKSFVLKATKSFCRQFCRAIGQPFYESVFIVSATTNTAAAQVQGNTIHSLAGLRSKLANILRNGKINWKFAKLLFLVEISMLT